jgi:hypothetical protein
MSLERLRHDRERVPRLDVRLRRMSDTLDYPDAVYWMFGGRSSMEKTSKRTALLALAVLLVSAACSGGTVEYRGQQIRLRRVYLSYDDYKNDPENIHPEDVKRVQDLVRSAPPGPEVGSWEEVSRGAHEITFPGYGSGSLSGDWEKLRAYSFEVPQANEERVLIFRAEGGAWRRVADLRVSGNPMYVKEPTPGTFALTDYSGRPVPAMQGEQR